MIDVLHRSSIAALAGSAFLLTGQALADMTVIESDDPTIEIGKTYADDAKVDVAPGKTVKLKTAADKTKVFVGTETAGDAKDAPIGGTRGDPE